MKKTLFALLFTMASILTFAQKKTYQLSSHILDVSKGLPASGVTIKLEKYSEVTKIWSFVEKKVTDENGRIADFLSADQPNIGIYRLTYYTSDYFRKNKTESFYPFIEVVFQIKDGAHYHVPITLSAYGYSTYRGN